MQRCTDEDYNVEVHRITASQRLGARRPPDQRGKPETDQQSNIARHNNYQNPLKTVQINK